MKHKEPFVTKQKEEQCKIKICLTCLRQIKIPNPLLTLAFVMRQTVLLPQSALFSDIVNIAWMVELLTNLVQVEILILRKGMGALEIYNHEVLEQVSIPSSSSMILRFKSLVGNFLASTYLDITNWLQIKLKLLSLLRQVTI